MAKVTGKNQTLVFNSETSGTNYCITEITVDITQDMFDAECAGGSNKERVAGMTATDLTVNGYIESQKMDDLFDDSSGSFAPGTNNSDLVWNPEGAGTGNPTFTSTSATVGNINISNPSNGLQTFTMVLHCDDYAIGALA